MRLTFHVRNLANRIYAAFSDPGYPDQIYLGEPRTYEVAAVIVWANGISRSAVGAWNDDAVRRRAGRCGKNSWVGGGRLRPAELCSC
jgi:hypothetical protein